MSKALKELAKKAKGKVDTKMKKKAFFKLIERLDSLREEQQRTNELLEKILDRLE